MILTNKFNLPESIVSAIKNDAYDAGDSDYTATQLVIPPRITLLTKRHALEIREDASENIWRLLGQAVHSILERADHDNELHEERIFARICDRRISGATDVFNDRGVLQDYKVTSAWTRVYGSRMEDWEIQLNILAHLFRSAGFAVHKLEVVCIYRDWSATQSLRSEDYPKQPVEVIPIPLWPSEDAIDLIQSRVEFLVKCEPKPDAELPPCTPVDMWEKATTYAAMKSGRKSAVKVCLNEDEAASIVASGKATHVEIRPGKRTRCEDYCSVNRWCNQYAAYVAERGEVADE